MKRLKAPLVVGILVVVSFLVIAFGESKDFKLMKNLEIYTSLFRELNLFYVDETDPEKLIKSSIDEMLKSLDPYTVYIPESELEDFRFTTTGEYGGIGSLIRKSGDYAVISEIYRGFPADLAGFKTGDLIIEIDGKSTRGMVITSISDRLKGTPGTSVAVTVKRQGMDESIQKTLKREKIQIKSVPYYGVLPEDIGYIRLTNFTQNAGREVKEALLDLRKEHELKGLILDLRGNPGGLLIEAVEVTNLFVGKGSEVVSTRGKVTDYDHTYYATKNPADTITPLTVLVNRGSASASEIVAGAIQDLDRGLILGERTFGKGLVQTTRPLSYNSQLKVTTAKYYIPSGRCIQALDYAHRNEDGSVGYIPDSLVSEFSTKNGRKVYDGGGIIPDIHSSPDEPSQIAIELYTRFFIFDYATHYSILHDTIPAPDEFVFSDKDYQDFIAYMNQRDFDYRTQTEVAMKRMEELAKREKYFERAQAEFDMLRSKLTHDKQKDFEGFKGEISQLVKEEITGRYYFQEGRIRTTILYDKQVQRALEMLLNPEQYSLQLRTDPALLLTDVK